MPRRFLLPEPIAPQGSIMTIRGGEAHHLSRVMRHRPGDTVEVFDGQGGSGRGVIETIGPQEVLIRITERAVAPPPTLRIHLAQALLKADKMDLVIQKAVELGVDSILPFRSQNCTAATASPHRLQRWRKIAREAAKQCGRTWLPAIAAPQDLTRILERFDHAILFWERAEAAAPPPLPTTGDCLLIVGPEGGFTDGEITQARERGVALAHLGPLVLRAETAAIAAIAITMFRLRHGG